MSSDYCVDFRHIVDNKVTSLYAKHPVSDQYLWEGWARCWEVGDHYILIMAIDSGPVLF